MFVLGRYMFNLGSGSLGDQIFPDFRIRGMTPGPLGGSLGSHSLAGVGEEYMDEGR